MSDLGSEKLWTVEEIAARLGVHAVTVRRWIRDERLSAYALGGKAGYRVKDSELNRFLKEVATPNARVPGSTEEC